VRLAAFTDPAAALRQRNRNTAAEARDTTTSHSFALGKASTTLLHQHRRHLLRLAYDRYTMTLDLADGIVPDQHIEPVLTDLARRIWPNLPPPGPPPNRYRAHQALHR
jgi:hypothetical protein